MNLVKVLTRVLGLVGLLLVCITFYTTRKDVTPYMYFSWCVDEGRKLYSLGAHHRLATNGDLLECTEAGWVPASDAACEEANTGAGTKSAPSSTRDDRK